jgi:hypothetical protein
MVQEIHHELQNGALRSSQGIPDSRGTSPSIAQHWTILAQKDALLE